MEKKKWLTLAVIKRNTKRKFHLSAAVHLSLFLILSLISSRKYYTRQTYKTGTVRFN